MCSSLFTEDFLFFFCFFLLGPGYLAQDVFDIKRDIPMDG